LNRVSIVPASDRELDLAEVPRAIRGAGFRPSDFHVRGVGTVEHAAPDCLRFRGWSRCYEAHGTGHASEGPSKVEASVVEQDGRVVLELTK